jgi:hypothetical protein
MAAICVWVILGNRSPLPVDFTSSIALGSGAELSGVMLTWAKEVNTGINIANPVNK